MLLTDMLRLRKKKIRGNNAPFMNKTLSKSIMTRSKLKNKYNKSPTEENRRLYNKQRNYCSNLTKKVKRDYYNNLDLNIFKDNKTFWKSIKPLFSDKQRDLQQEIILIEKELVVTDEQEVAEKMNHYFIDVIENLDIEPFIEQTANDDNTLNSIKDIVKKYNQHPSILKIKQYATMDDKFTFFETTIQQFQTQIELLDP